MVMRKLTGLLGAGHADHNFIPVTTRWGDLAPAIIGSNAAVADTRFVVNNSRKEEVVERLRLVLESGQLLVDHVHEDQPQACRAGGPCW